MKIADATVMVVDDEPELVQIFSFWLKRGGARVLTAHNGAEALKQLAEQPVHALISDIRMPVMDGITLVQRIHELKYDIPIIIFVSGFADVSLRSLYATGVVAMISKPLRRDQLVTTLEHGLRERDELWLTPSSAPAEKELSVQFNSLDEARAVCDFGLGTGGCAFLSPKAMPECTVEFHIHFANDALQLDGQGIVRWYDSRTQHVGIEFTYLEPASRRWLLQQISSTPVSSFIPSCA